MMQLDMRSQRGVTIIEATIVLSVFALLASIMAPAASTYIDTARQTRARADVRIIAEAIQSFIADTGENQFLQDANGTVGVPTTPPGRADGNRVNLLVSNGDVPILATAITGETYWRLPVNSTTVDTFSNHLIENRPQEAIASRYRNPSDMVVPAPGGDNPDFARGSSSGFNAPHAWRGPYMRGPVDPDPWGNRYAANVVFLDPTVGAAIGALSNDPSTGLAWTAANYPRLDVFVMSAGPDEEIDTLSAQDGAVPGDDDFIYIVSSNAK